MSGISPTDSRLSRPEIQVLISRYEAELKQFYSVGSTPAVERFADYNTILEAFKPEISKPFHAQEQIKNDLDATKKISWNDSVKDLIRDIGSSVEDQLKDIMTNILYTFHPKLPENSFIRPNDHPSGHPITKLKSGVVTGVSRCSDILKVICMHLANTGSLTLQKFRKYIWAGMNFTDRLAALSGEDDTILIDAMCKPLENFTVSESKVSKVSTPKVDFVGSHKTCLQGLEAKARARTNPASSCPTRKILLRIPSDQKHHKGSKIVNLVKASYWLLAKRVEAELFKKDAA